MMGDMRTGDEPLMSVDELTALVDEEPARPRAWLVALVSGLVLIAIIVLILLAQRGERALAELRVRDDTVEVKAQGDFRRGVEGQALALGNTVRTDTGGQAQIDYFDGSLTRLGSDTNFVIRELQSGPDGKRIRVKVDAGRIFNRVEKLASSKDRFEMAGATAVATVRGTMNFVFADQAPITYYLGYTGTTIVTFGDETFVLDKKDECVRTEPDGMRRCTKHELEALKETTFYRENVALEGGSLPGRPKLSPTASQSASPAPPGLGRRSPAVGSASAPTTTPKRTRRPSIDDPNETDEPTDEPPTTTQPPPPTPPPTSTPTPPPPTTL
jgi:hypothetical protein